MVGRSQGPAVLDGLRAATRLSEVDIPADAPMGVTGFSQGGGAAVWAAELQPSYAPELPLAGVAAGGVPADLTRVAENIDGSLYFSFLAFAAVGYSTAYPELPFEEHLNDSGRALLADAADDCLVEALPKGIGKSMDDLTGVDLIATPEWQARLTENLPGSDAPDAPLYLYHSRGDDVIPVDQAEELRGRYCAAGAAVEWTRTHSGPHAASWLLDTGAAHAWLGDRLAGEPAEGDCA
jgi:dienelactone hydrolase